ncbi:MULTISPECIES: hypothetical protein [Acidithiobacillus]|uniref:Uncharacterized protein n=1 Tax=Acidithiobacillus sulfuriphilus TaxID=1867749 RepID=A0ACD5HNE3_9PROT|nr:hypothetical protein [Acidithiobacillus sulfuriphilus]
MHSPSLLTIIGALESGTWHPGYYLDGLVTLVVFGLVFMAWSEYTTPKSANANPAVAKTGKISTSALIGEE